MYFNKEEQRRRAAEFAAQQLAKGVAKPAPQPVPVTKKASWQIPHFTNTSNPIDFPKAKPAQKARRPKKLNYSTTEFKNHLGQVIQPGQKVICVTTGYSHRVAVTEAVYLGNRGSSVVVERTHPRIGNTFRRTLPAGRIYPTL